MAEEDKKAFLSVSKAMKQVEESEIKGFRTKNNALLEVVTKQQKKQLRGLGKLIAEIKVIAKPKMDVKDTLRTDDIDPQEEQKKQTDLLEDLVENRS